MQFIARCADGQKHSFELVDLNGTFADTLYDEYLAAGQRFKMMTGGSPVMRHFDVLDSTEDVEDGADEQQWFDALEQWKKDREAFIRDDLAARLGDLNDILADEGVRLVSPSVEVVELLEVTA